MDTAHPERVFDGQARGSSLLPNPNCSISPSGLWRVFAAVALVTLGIGIGFACFGAWLILPFAGPELPVLAAAFVVPGRHATDCERIGFSAARVRVEVRISERTAVHEFDPARAQVVLGEGRGTMRVWLLARDARLETGRRLDEASGDELAAEIRRRLRRDLAEGKT